MGADFRSAGCFFGLAMIAPCFYYRWVFQKGERNLLFGLGFQGAAMRPLVVSPDDTGGRVWDVCPKAAK